MGIRDAAVIPGIRERFENEEGFEKSLLRSLTAREALEQAAALIKDADATTNPLSRIDARLDDAVNLVAATASPDTRLRAIRQVREVIAEWADYDDERRLFSTVIDAGLEELAGYVRGDTRIESPHTILGNIRQNVDQAIDWANENRYLNFANNLSGVMALLNQVVG